MKKGFIPFLIYFIAAISFFSYRFVRVGNNSAEQWHFLEVVALILTTMGTLYFIYIEVKQMKKKSSAYFSLKKGWWNCIDVSSLGLNSFLLLDLITQFLTKETTILLTFFSIILMWVNLINWLRLFEWSTLFIRLI